MDFLLGSHQLLQLGAAGAVLLLFSLLATSTYNLYFHPLSKYPGPRFCAASKLPYASNISRGNIHFWMKDLHDRYGDIVRVAPDRLSFIGPQAWKDIYGHRKANQQMIGKDKKFYSPDVNGEFSLVTTRDLDEHAMLRRVFSHAFSDKALKEQGHIIQRYADQFIDVLKLANRQDPEKEVDMVKLFNCATFDIMSDLTFGEPLGMLDNSEYTPWIKKIFANFRFSAVRHVTEEYPLLKFLLKILVPKSVKKARKEHFQYASDRVERRLEKGNNEPDIWNLVLKRPDVELPFLKMVSNASLFMIAGTETTATTLSGLTFYLLKNPEKLRRLQDEIRSLSSEDELNLDNLPRLKYLGACLHEGFRMYPAVPIGLPRVVPNGCASICGELIPAGTRVSVPQFAAYHSHRHFTEADSFLPERWLLDSPGFEDDNRDVVQPFSIGSRNCLGKNLAWHELRLLFAKLVWHFDLELDPRCADWANQKAFTLWDKPPLWVKTRRVR